MPQARAAAFDQDPFAGLIELWVLSEQQHQHFDEGAGKGALGDRENCALRTTERLVQGAEQMASEVMSDQEFARMKEIVGRLGGPTSHRRDSSSFARPRARTSHRWSPRRTMVASRPLEAWKKPCATWVTE